MEEQAQGTVMPVERGRVLVAGRAAEDAEGASWLRGLQQAGLEIVLEEEPAMAATLVGMCSLFGSREPFDVVVIDFREPGVVEFMRDLHFQDPAAQRVVIQAEKDFSRLTAVVNTGRYHAILEGAPEDLILSKVREAVVGSWAAHYRHARANYFPVDEALAQDDGTRHAVSAALECFEAGKPLLIGGPEGSGRSLLARYLVFRRNPRRTPVPISNLDGKGVSVLLDRSDPRSPSAFVLSDIDQWSDEEWAPVRVAWDSDRRSRASWIFISGDAAAAVERLGEVEVVTLPGLNERSADLVRLADGFLYAACFEARADAMALADSARAQLRAHRFGAGGLPELREWMARTRELYSSERRGPLVVELPDPDRGYPA